MADNDELFADPRDLATARHLKPRGYLRLTGDSEAMTYACQSAEVSPNAIRGDGDWSLGSPIASVACPSFFVDDHRFARMLAYFVDMGLWFAVDLEFESDGAKSAAAVRLHPAIDDTTLDLMNEIAPGRGDAVRRVQQRLQRFLRHLSVPGQVDAGGDREGNT